MLSSGTQETSARNKNRGAKLGRPKRSLSKNTKLTDSEEDIRELLKSKVSDKYNCKDNESKQDDADKVG